METEGSAPIIRKTVIGHNLEPVPSTLDIHNLSLLHLHVSLQGVLYRI